MTQAQREAIIKEAHTWIGTPYRGWSCVKGCGADCGQFIYGVYRAVGLIPALELPQDYSLQVSQHRASTEYIDIVTRHFREITEAEAQPGDLVVYKLGLAYAHAGLIISWPEILQAEARHGVCGAHGIKSPVVRHKPRRFFTLKEG